MSWVDNSDSEDAFVIERKLAAGRWENLAIVGAQSESYTDTTVRFGTYTYRIRAKSGAEYSDYSNEVLVALTEDGFIEMTGLSLMIS